MCEEGTVGPVGPAAEMELLPTFYALSLQPWWVNMSLDRSKSNDVSVQ